jgi:hypothetical protein
MNRHRRRLKNSLLVFLHYYPVFPVLTRKKPQCPRQEMQFQFLRLPRMSPIEAAFHQCAPCNGENLPLFATIQPASSEEERCFFRCLGSEKTHEKGSKTHQEVSCSARPRDGRLPSVGCGWKRRIDSMDLAWFPRSVCALGIPPNFNRVRCAIFWSC